MHESLCPSFSQTKQAFQCCPVIVAPGRVNDKIDAVLVPVEKEGNQVQVGLRNIWVEDACKRYGHDKGHKGSAQ